MPARGMNLGNIPIEVMLAIATDPEGFKKSLKEYDKTATAAEEAKSKAEAEWGKVNAERAAIVEKEDKLLEDRADFETYVARENKRVEGLDAELERKSTLLNTREAEQKAKSEALARKETGLAGIESEQSSAAARQTQTDINQNEREAELDDRTAELHAKEVAFDAEKRELNDLLKRVRT